MNDLKLLAHAHIESGRLTRGIFYSAAWGNGSSLGLIDHVLGLETGGDLLRLASSLSIPPWVVIVYDGIFERAAPNELADLHIAMVDGLARAGPKWDVGLATFSGGATTLLQGDLGCDPVLIAGYRAALGVLHRFPVEMRFEQAARMMLRSVTDSTRIRQSDLRALAQALFAAMAATRLAPAESGNLVRRRSA